MRSPQEIDRKFTEDQLLEKVNQVEKWFHTIPLGTNVKTPGKYNSEFYEKITNVIPQDLSGKTILDVGTRNGAYAFECERRGAKEIVAIDKIGENKPFKICKEILDSKVELLDMDFFNIEKIGKKFDIVLFLGVIYHLTDPFLAMKILHNITRESVIMEGAILESPIPTCYFLDRGELGGNPTNTFLLSPTLIHNYAIQEAGFKNVKFFGYMGTPTVVESSKKYGNGKYDVVRNRGIFYLEK